MSMALCVRDLKNMIRWNSRPRRSWVRYSSSTPEFRCDETLRDEPCPVHAPHDIAVAQIFNKQLPRLENSLDDSIRSKSTIRRAWDNFDSIWQPHRHGSEACTNSLECISCILPYPARKRSVPSKGDKMLNSFPVVEF